jgi:hypothetical protein
MTHNQIDNILVEGRQNSSVLDVRLFRKTDCDNDHYLVVAKVRERLEASNQTTHKFHIKRFNIKKFK